MDKFAEVDLLARDPSTLSKKERKMLKKQLEQKESFKEQRQGTIIKWAVIAIIVLLFGAFAWFLFQRANKPLPGTFLENQGRDHITVAQWMKFNYSSNPPTSGPHDPVWSKSGIYDSPQGDGYLVHSLEHGYIILSYNCNVDGVSTKAQATEKQASISSQLVPADKLPAPLTQKDCDKLKKELTDIANQKTLWKLIVVPRPNMDTRIALTAWTRIEKLSELNKEQILAFIDAFRNHGPEQTME